MPRCVTDDLLGLLGLSVRLRASCLAPRGFPAKGGPLEVEIHF